MKPTRNEIIRKILGLRLQDSDAKLVELAKKLRRSLGSDEPGSQEIPVMEGRSSTPPTLLLVDDNRELIEIAARYVGEIRPAWRFLLAHSLEEGRQVHNLYSPDAAVLDVSLPDGNGLDLLSELKHHRPGMPIIMISGDDSKTLRQAVIDRGGSSLISKPFSALELVNQVELAISASQEQGGGIELQPELSGVSKNQTPDAGLAPQSLEVQGIVQGQPQENRRQGQDQSQRNQGQGQGPSQDQ